MSFNKLMKTRRAPSNSGAFTPFSMTLRRSARRLGSGISARLRSRTSSGWLRIMLRGPIAKVTIPAIG